MSSRSRDDASGPSNSVAYPGLQVIGKRIRRKPQWLDGDRSDGLTSGGGGRRSAATSGSNRGKGRKKGLSTSKHSGAAANSTNNHSNQNSNNNSSLNDDTPLVVTHPPSKTRAKPHKPHSKHSKANNSKHKHTAAVTPVTTASTTHHYHHVNNDMDMPINHSNHHHHSMTPPVVVETAATNGSNNNMMNVANNINNDSESTASVHSNDSATAADVPVVDNPIAAMHTGLSACRGGATSRRDVVDAFHSWQKVSVSKQAAQLKSLHVALKRRLRKRTIRLPEMDRTEDEAVRNARRGLDDEEAVVASSAVVKKGKGKRGKAKAKADAEEQQRVAASRRKTNELIEENSLHGNTCVPSKIRLPLEAYLPRLVRPQPQQLHQQHNGHHPAPPAQGPTEADVLAVLPDPPRLPTALKSQGKAWLTLPTVVPSAEWNSRKSVNVGNHAQNNGLPSSQN